MKKDENYFGIKLNDDVPKLDKINEYSKEVELKFLGKAYLVERNDGQVEKTEIKNYYKLEKEGKYEIEFINNKDEIYTIHVRIKKSYVFLILLLFLGILLGILLTRPIDNEGNLFTKFYNYIDFTLLELRIDEKEENSIIEYDFDVTFENLTSEDIELKDTTNKNTNNMSAKSIAKNRIAPGVSGSFSILISTKNSMVDMNYSITFEDVTNDKPNNLLFKIRGQGEEFYSLQELEQYLTGLVKKRSLTTIIVDWRWPYEIDESQDIIDTKDGKSLENYKFRINVKGEEAI